MKTKVDQILELNKNILETVETKMPTKVQTLFWNTLHNLIKKDIDRGADIHKAIDGIIKDIEKNKKPSCDKLINALENKINLIKEVFKLKNGDGKKTDWADVLKELKKYEK